MNNAIPIIGTKQKSVCRHCGRPSHPFTTKCNYNDLLAKIEKLTQANSIIPSIMQANSETTKIANTFRVVAENTAKAIVLLEEMVREQPNGEELWESFKVRLGDKWEAVTSVQGIGENTSPLSPESTIQSVTESKPSTDQTAPGETTAPDSSL